MGMSEALAILRVFLFHFEVKSIVSVTKQLHQSSQTPIRISNFLQNSDINMLKLVHVQELFIVV